MLPDAMVKWQNYLAMRNTPQGLILLQVYAAARDQARAAYISYQANLQTISRDFPFTLHYISYGVVYRWQIPQRPPLPDVPDTWSLTPGQPGFEIASVRYPDGQTGFMSMRRKLYNGDPVLMRAASSFGLCAGDYHVQQEATAFYQTQVKSLQGKPLQLKLETPLRLGLP
jgi:hypothetical protein